MRGKIIHFSNSKILDLTSEEAQYFIDVTGARALSGYGAIQTLLPSTAIDKAFFSLCQELNDVRDIVEELFEEHYNLCKLLDFRLYY